jgi:hypothetical protein
MLDRKFQKYTSFTSTALILICLCGCLGTGATRFDNGSFVGKYPYSGTASDIVIIGKSFSSEKNRTVSPALVFFLGILSFPVDIIVDSILFPADLIAWPIGYEKDWPGQ